MDSYDITASALTAQRLRMDTISSNLANVNTTRKADGSIGAYHRRNVVFSPILAQSNSRYAPNGKDFRPEGGSAVSNGELAMRGAGSVNSGGQMMLRASITNNNSAAAAGVQVVGIEEDTETPMKMVYDPGNPDADAKGYVEMPNVNVVTEMVDMISASRAYEANVTALQSAKGMAQSALEL
jgi:flagellar basal-body rod protein FlgC